MVPNPREAPTGLKEDFYQLCAALVIGCRPPSWNYSRSPQVQQFLFWQLYCQTTCLLVMLLSLQSIDVSDIVLGKLPFPRHCLGTEHEKPGTALCTCPSCVLDFTKIEVGKLHVENTMHRVGKRSDINLYKSVVARLSRESPEVCGVSAGSLKCLVHVSFTHMSRFTKFNSRPNSEVQRSLECFILF